jgi:GTP cyclohydrolase II
MSWHSSPGQESVQKGATVDSAVQATVAMMKASRFPDDAEHYRDYQSEDGRTWRISMISRAKLPTRFGDFSIYGFHDSRGKPGTHCHRARRSEGLHDIPVRVHSECHTGDIFGSLRCDCRDQLEAALSYIGSRDAGAVLYMRQEGRGIGLLNKIQAYNLQDQGRDTVEANEDLGLPAEAREYQSAAAMLDLLGIGSIALMTNNPAKLTALSDAGILISRRIPIVIEPNVHNSRYLITKKVRMGHLY